MKQRILLDTDTLTSAGRNVGVQFADDTNARFGVVSGDTGFIETDVLQINLIGSRVDISGVTSNAVTQIRSRRNPVDA